MPDRSLQSQAAAAADHASACQALAVQVQPGCSRASSHSLTSVSSITEMLRCLACAGVDKTLRMAVNMMTKSLLQYLELVVAEPDFAEMWARMLQVLQVGSGQSGQACLQHPLPLRSSCVATPMHAARL